MRTERCKCGNAIRFGSGMTYHPCEGCEECQTTFAGHPDFHEPLQPHDFRPVYDRYTGQPEDEECTRCGVSKKRLEKIRADAKAEKERKAGEQAEQQRELEDGTAAYKALVDAEIERTGNMPHCDSLVLHAPGECKYCDERGNLQSWRLASGVNFTGHSDPAKKPCFAERRRPAETINRWGGNVAAPAES